MLLRKPRQGLQVTHTSRSSTWRWRYAGTADWFPRWCPGRSRAPRGRRRAEVASCSGGLEKKKKKQQDDEIKLWHAEENCNRTLVSLCKWWSCWMYCCLFVLVSVEPAQVDTHPGWNYSFHEVDTRVATSGQVSGPQSPTEAHSFQRSCLISTYSKKKKKKKFLT